MPLASSRWGNFENGPVRTRDQRKLASYFMGLDAHSAGYKRIMHGAMLQPEYGKHLISWERPHLHSPGQYRE
jgi:hypothetical protein